MSRNRMLRSALLIVMVTAQALCLVGALSVWWMADDDSYLYSAAEFEVRKRNDLVLAYALFSVGSALLVGLCRFIRADHEAQLSASDGQSRASNA